MHELSVTQGLLKICLEEGKKHNINRIKEKYNINYDVSLVAVSKYSSIETIKEFLSLNIDLLICNCIGLLLFAILSPPCIKK